MPWVEAMVEQIRSLTTVARAPYACATPTHIPAAKATPMPRKISHQRDGIDRLGAILEGKPKKADSRAERRHGNRTAAEAGASKEKTAWLRGFLW